MDEYTQGFRAGYEEALGRVSKFAKRLEVGDARDDAALRGQLEERDIEWAQRTERRLAEGEGRLAQRIAALEARVAAFEAEDTAWAESIEKRLSEAGDSLRKRVDALDKRTVVDQPG